MESIPVVLPTSFRALSVDEPLETLLSSNGFVRSSPSVAEFSFSGGQKENLVILDNGAKILQELSSSEEVAVVSIACSPGASSEKSKLLEGLVGLKGLSIAKTPGVSLHLCQRPFPPHLRQLPQLWILPKPINGIVFLESEAGDFPPGSPVSQALSSLALALPRACVFVLNGPALDFSLSGNVCEFVRGASSIPVSIAARGGLLAVVAIGAEDGTPSKVDPPPELAGACVTLGKRLSAFSVSGDASKLSAELAACKGPAGSDLRMIFEVSGSPEINEDFCKVFQSAVTSLRRFLEMARTGSVIVPPAALTAAIDALIAGNVKGWPLMRIELLRKELENDETAQRNKEEARSECQKTMEKLWSELRSSHAQTPDEFRATKVALSETLAVLTRAFDPWCTDVVASAWPAKIESFEASLRTISQKAINDLFRDAAQNFFKNLGSVCPEGELGGLSKQLKTQGLARISSITFENLVPPAIDMKPSLERFRECIKEVPPFARPPDIEYKLSAFIERLTKVFLELGNELAAEIRRFAIAEFLQPEFVEKLTIRATTVEEAAGQIVAGTIVQSIPKHELDTRLVSKLRAVVGSFKKYATHERKWPQDRWSPHLTSLAADLSRIAGCIKEACEKEGGLIDLQVRSTREAEGAWRAVLGEVFGMGSSFRSKSRGFQPEPPTSWFLVDIPGEPARVGDIVRAIGAANDSSRLGMVARPVMIRFARAIIEHPKRDVKYLSSVIPALLLSKVGVLPVATLFFPARRLATPEALCVVVVLATAEDCAKSCGNRITAHGDSFVFQPCPKEEAGSSVPEAIERLAVSEATFLSLEEDCGKVYAVLPDSPYENEIKNGQKVFFPTVLAVCSSPASDSPSAPPSSTSPPPPPLTGSKFGAGFDFMQRVWDPTIFGRVRKFRNIGDVPPSIASKAWDAETWLQHYNSLELQAKAADRANLWRDEGLCGMRVLVASSTKRFLDCEKAEQVARRTSAARETLETIVAPSPPVGETIKTDIILPTPAPLFSHTEVRVVNMDCLEASRQLKLAFPGSRVCCLNMANQFHPGGGWTRGRHAQEESLFFRTALSASLIPSLYEPAGLGEFTCIYSRDVGVIREGITTGFAFLAPAAQWRCDFVTMAAYDLSTKSGPPRQFTADLAAKTRMKIEAILALSAASGATVLVLGAMGTGAFKQPSFHVSVIFREVIDQFAGCFERIYFAIASPSRNDQKIADFAANLLGSFAADACCIPVTQVQESEATCRKYASWRQTEMPPSDVTKPCCQYAGLCNHSDPRHFVDEQHPPICPRAESCEGRGDELHRHLWFHPQACPGGCICAAMFDPDRAIVASHASRFNHPPPCPMAGKCTVHHDQAHCAAFLHPPFCGEGLACSRIGDPAHAAARRHGRMWCPEYRCCSRFAESGHIAQFQHPFAAPCSRTPFLCKDGSTKHAQEASHVCPFGPTCSQINDTAHQALAIHTGALCMAPSCSDLSEDHLATYWHQNSSPLLRTPCPEVWCTSADTRHRRENCHELVLAHSPTVNLNRRVRFESNCDTWRSMLDRYLATAGRSINTSLPAFIRIKDWVESLRPTMALTVEEFTAVATTGVFYSRTTIIELFMNLQALVSQVVARPGVRALLGQQQPNQACLTFLECHLAVRRREMASAVASGIRQRISARGSESEKNRLTGVYSVLAEPEIAASVTERILRDLNDTKDSLVHVNGDAWVRTLETEATSLIGAVVVLLEQCSGAGFTAEREMGTENHVRCSFGPLPQESCSEIVVVFRPAVMFSPDFFLLPCRAVSYYSGTYRYARPWMGPQQGKQWHAGGMADFTLEKQHPSAQGLAEAVAKEVIFRVGALKGIEADRVNLELVKLFWSGYTPFGAEATREAFEAFLPSAVPFDFVEHICATQQAHQKLASTSADAGKLLSSMLLRFGHSAVEVLPGTLEVALGTSAFLSKASATQIPRGFCFVPFGLLEQFVPTELPPDQFCVFFNSRGGNLFVTLSNTDEVAQPSRQVLTFFIAEETGDASAFTVPPANCASSPPIQMAKGFNSIFPPDRTVRHVLLVDQVRKTVTLAHTGQSRIFSTAEFCVTAGIPSPCSFIAFASLTQPTVSSIFVSRARLPEAAHFIDSAPPSC